MFSAGVCHYLLLLVMFAVQVSSTGNLHELASDLSRKKLAHVSGTRVWYKLQDSRAAASLV